ncbi:MAG: hypothetical protein ACYDEQ_06920 [Desulfocucumaceae bacterium]
MLKQWEPNFSNYKERLACLRLAHSLGFKTSVLMQPMLDNPEAVIEAVKPYVTETIWLGKAKRLRQRLSANGRPDKKTMAKANELIKWQSAVNLKALHQRLKCNPQIRWDKTIQKAIGLKRSK